MGVLSCAMKLRAVVTFAALAAIVAMCSPIARAQDASDTPQQKWFRDAKFGMFIHWGVYSVLGDGEWVMNNRHMSIEDYETLPQQFNPVDFNAAEWVAIAKAAGAKYITITSKHHDGFAMFATKQTSWNVVDRTPWKQDPLAELARECRKQGIKLFFYYSQLDWHHPDYYPLGETGQSAGRPPGGHWERYLDFMNAQLTELLTNYGPIGGIWLDGWWDKPQADWQLERTYALIHRLQPQALIGNNHHHAPFPGEDFQMFERDLPGQTTADWNKNPVISKLPLETCDTVNDSWGYTRGDHHWKSSKELIRYLVGAAGHNANLLLNVGPMPTGRIQPEAVERLKEMGAWLAKYGDSIYGTRGGPIAPRSWGVTTQKGNRIFVHLLDWQDPALLLPRLEMRGTRAYLMQSGAPVQVSETNAGTLLRLPTYDKGAPDNIVVLETAQ
jgi:alpha-L-fucosidase